jgi:hypothetical protein
MKIEQKRPSRAAPFFLPSAGHTWEHLLERLPQPAFAFTLAVRRRELALYRCFDWL